MKLFAHRLLDWAKTHGRHDLPWQPSAAQDKRSLPDPYKIWVAEIMLQQTQVKTVIPYYQRFMQRFPNLSSLSSASLDDVLAHWSGLGYYARGRNLHKAAQIRATISDTFPSSVAELLDLPGIGLSTANAVSSQTLDIPLAILDGNAKRVLARHAGIFGWSGKSSVQKQLWQIAEDRLPKTQGAAYTQAIIDLGASLCSRSKPDCANCPVQTDCFAFNEQQIDALPGRKTSKKNPDQFKQLFILRNAAGQVFLEKRPPSGIWGGLWSLPEKNTLDKQSQQLELPQLIHNFSHFRLHISPILQTADTPQMLIHDDEGKWFSTTEWRQLGLAAPIRQILEQTVKIAISK